ncbi:MAG: amidohydrolase [Deltaproteobacteria bacterium]|nr:amidohydrolase [Deltaproteobacteria bacterium]MBW2333722.1 amidohydrolase [Deltaproteobacteria bacterium]
MLGPNLPSINDMEGSTVPAGLPEVVDAHVHIFPHDIFSAIWHWFDKHAWHIRYQLSTSQIFDFLLSRGITHIVALQYAHKPGIAGKLNRYMAMKCQKYPNQVAGMATIFPGEKNAAGILHEAFAFGLGGLKLHAHVQCFDMNADDMNLLYDICQLNNKPMIMHVGREPKSTAYHCDPYQICSAEKLERVLRNFPKLRICVPHFGFDEISAYKKLIEKYDNLWLDTTMILSGYFFPEDAIELDSFRLDRIMYGSDFPNIPYAWDRELKRLRASGLPQENLEWILRKSANSFFGLG